MGQIIQLAKANLPITLAVLAGLVILIITILKIISRKKAKNKEIRKAASDFARDESLNSFILNKHESAVNKSTYVPYDVDYSRGAEIDGKLTEELRKTPMFMIQITEQNELATRKFVLDAVKGIHIGSDFQNDIYFVATNKLNYKCQIFANSAGVFARNMNLSAPITIFRRGKSTVLDEEGIKIMSGDKIVMGNYSYTITFVNKRRKS